MVCFTEFSSVSALSRGHVCTAHVFLHAGVSMVWQYVCSYDKHMQPIVLAVLLTHVVGNQSYSGAFSVAART